MDIDAYIASGILENYCLGFCSPEENTLIEKYAGIYPGIKTEIEKIRASLEEYFIANEIKPSPAVKTAVMLSVYRQVAAENTGYAPLIDDAMDKGILTAWIASIQIDTVTEDFENLFITELPSTSLVTNFIVHAKSGHEAEKHEDFVEYLYVVRGSCIMDFEGELRSYQEGDIIHIKPHINHTATVTSAQPMIALVQRQAC